MRIRIRQATVTDLPTLVRHRRRMFEEMGETNVRQLARHDRVYRQWARVRLRHKELIAFVAEANGQIAGSGCVWLQERQPRPGLDHPHVPYLLSMFTDPDFRGCGIASRIVNAAHTWCRKHGHRNISLHASQMGRGIYKRLGYVRSWEMRLRL